MKTKLIVLFVFFALVACSARDTRFPLAPPLWIDPDNSLVTKPQKYFSGLYSDAIEQTIVRPIYENLYPESALESTNVNSMDEVPSSSWFENRIGQSPMTLQEVALGSCDCAPLQSLSGDRKSVV